MHNSVKIIVTVCVPMLLMWAGCKAPQKVYTSADNKLPDTYQGSTDTTVPVLRKDFFKDPNLATLIDEAMRNNFDVLIAQQRIAMASSNVLMSKSPLLPTVGINTFGSNIKYGRHTMDGAGNATTPEVPGPLVPSYMIGVSSQWEVDMWGKLRNKKKAAQLRYIATEMGRNLVVTSMLSEIAYRYYELVSLEDEMNIINRNIKLQETALDIINIQKEAGRATELATKQFEALVTNTKSLKFEVKQQMIKLENELNFLAGRYQSPIARGKSIFDAPLPVVVKTGIPTALLQHRPDIMQAELELTATKADVAAARAAYLPSFSITAHAGYNTYHPELIFDPVSTAFGLIGTLTGPLLNRRNINASHAMAIAENKAAYYSYSKTTMNAIYEVQTTMSSIENLEAKYALNEQEAKTLEDATKIANELYLAGYANYLEVVTAQGNAIAAELKAVKTKKELLFSTVNLYRALGGGWE